MRALALVLQNTPVSELIRLGCSLRKLNEVGKGRRVFVSSPAPVLSYDPAEASPRALFEWRLL